MVTRIDCTQVFILCLNVGMGVCTAFLFCILSNLHFICAAAVSSTPLFSIQNSTLLISWDFRSIPHLADLTIDFGCVNPSTVVGGNVSYIQ